MNKEGESYRKTGNIVKNEKKLLKVRQRLIVLYKFLVTAVELL